MLRNSIFKTSSCSISVFICWCWNLPVLLVIFTGRQSCCDTFNPLYIKLHRRNTSSVPVILPTRHAIRRFRCQERSNVVCQASGIYLWVGWNITDGSTAHDPEPGVLGDFVHATTVLARPPDTRSVDFIPKPHKVSSHVLVSKQRSSAQTGTYGDHSL